MAETEEDLWNSLHDAILEGIEVDFGRGAVTIRVRLLSDAEAGRIPIRLEKERAEAARHPDARPGALGPARIVCEDFRRFVCPREQPWGRSGKTAYVNELKRRTHGDGWTVLEILLNGGDQIEIQARQATISRVA
jgi:hypothetical protein